MAAFVTALIPDLTLLHFRNTTEAGATSGSRDKGLHGKLKAGVCYSMLDTINSRHQRVVVGVRLQQVAGRDRKWTSTVRYPGAADVGTADTTGDGDINDVRRAYCRLLS